MKPYKMTPNRKLKLRKKMLKLFRSSNALGFCDAIDDCITENQLWRQAIQAKPRIEFFLPELLKYKPEKLVAFMYWFPLCKASNAKRIFILKNVIKQLKSETKK